MRSSVSNRCLGSSRWGNRVPELVALIAHGLTVPRAHGRSRSSAFAGSVDDRTTRAGRGDSSKPGGRLYLHQEAFGVIAANAAIRHQLEPWAARLREDQPHLLAACRARQFGHSETRTGRSRFGCWLHRRLTHRGIRNATNMLSLAASARIWTEPPRMISTSANANRFQSPDAGGNFRRGGWRKHLHSNDSPAFSAVPRGSQRNCRLTMHRQKMWEIRPGTASTCCGYTHAGVKNWDQFKLMLDSLSPDDEVAS
jgi:hypothetical protein